MTVQQTYALVSAVGTVIQAAGAAVFLIDRFSHSSNRTTVVSTKGKAAFILTSLALSITLGAILTVWITKFVPAPIVKTVYIEKTGNATTTGDQSPANTGNGNTTTYGQQPPADPPAKKD